MGGLRWMFVMTVRLLNLLRLSCVVQSRTVLFVDALVLSWKDAYGPSCNTSQGAWVSAQRFASISFHHVFREQNQVADLLAKSAHSQPLGLTLWDDAPPGLGDKIGEDKLGAKYYRRVSVTMGSMP
nr:uncharacterized protein LOC109190924 [Ipomoea batatas]